MPGFLGLVLLWLSFAPSLTAQKPVAIRSVAVFDGARLIPDRTVLLEQGVIAAVGGPELAIPVAADLVEGRGRTLLPGLIDAHVHLSDGLDHDLRQAASLGVTTLLDMWSGSARLERIKAIRAADPPDMADVRTAGKGATAPGGHPSQMGGPPFPTISDSASADQFVATRFQEGSDYLKIIYDDLGSLGMKLPMLDRPTLAGLIAAARARGKLAVVHVLTEAQARDAIEAGASGLVHLFTGATVGPDFGRLVADHGAFVVPTLTVLYGSCGRPTGPEVLADTLLRPYIHPRLRPLLTMNPKRPGPTRSCAGTEEAIRQLKRTGVPILAGTDAPVGQTYGASIHNELVLLAGAGLTPAEALTAATAAPARAFGLTDRGRIAPGLRADLLLVEGDPTVDLKATRRIVAIWKHGDRVNRIRFPD